MDIRRGLLAVATYIHTYIHTSIQTRRTCLSVCLSRINTFVCVHSTRRLPRPSLPRTLTTTCRCAMRYDAIHTYIHPPRHSGQGEEGVVPFVGGCVGQALLKFLPGAVTNTIDKPSGFAIDPNPQHLGQPEETSSQAGRQTGQADR